MYDSQKYPKKRRLATTIWADQRDTLATICVEIKRVENTSWFEGRDVRLTDAIQLYDAVGHSFIVASTQVGPAA